ncbi:[NiFe]-hydrogenase assembly chaperone HybE [Azospira restricta]|uniref:[NiFe]-hydrogenase assembly chaperone HybE n=1 Tax=Azospira restricta TaxID=404405 RepID=A0A974PX64_9RHOO|nr:[NiFe]-hydrogenase assembly chaperone HybE [Azospira restricta]QRJ63122.1 [NiFe]-hydrogenase assembly chaperone HybE [Azospira restricta]
MVDERIRKPLYRAERPAAPAIPHADNPAPQVLAMYRRIWETTMRDLDFVNRALEVDIAGFRRHRGDWVGAVITPWFVNLCVLPGGGELWQDLGAGERVKLPFPVGELEFIADYDLGAEIPAALHCPLLAPVTALQSQDVALRMAMDALETLFTPAAASVEAPPSAMPAASSDVLPPAPSPDPSVPPRRAFLRRLAGQRG